MTIAHNHLNLPRLFTWTGGGYQGNSVDVRCDAAGTKLRKTVKTGATVNNVQDYIGGIEYRDGSREAIYSAAVPRVATTGWQQRGMGGGLPQRMGVQDINKVVHVLKKKELRSTCVTP